MQWLTNDLKAKHLQELVDEAGRRLDHEAMLELAKINMIDGLVTTGCCVGHRRGSKWNLGYISIRTDRPKEELFEHHLIPALLKQPFVVNIKKWYELDENYDTWTRFVFGFDPGGMAKVVTYIVAWCNANSAV